ncbi:MAG: tripartite tricarboxylate transporter substrate binding protein [Gammaproteobacteria bacterium]
MHVTKRSFSGILVAIALGAAAGDALAQAYPSGPIKFIVPRGPGGGSDTIARLVAPGVSEKLGAPVQIENRPDATAVLGAELVAQAKPDGHTFYISDNSFYQNPAVLPKVPYDTVKDFTGVTMFAQGPVVLIVHPAVPANTLKELLQLAKNKDLSYASGGIGSSTHLVGVMVNLKGGVNMTHVPFKGSGPALNALLGNHVSMQYGGLSSALPHIQKGSVKAIATTGTARHKSIPDVPTFTEAGLPDVDVPSVWGIHAPAGTPLDVRRKMREAIVATMKEPGVAARMQEMGYEMIGNTPEEHQRQTEKIVSTWLDVGKRVSLRE